MIELGELDAFAKRPHRIPQHFLGNLGAGLDLGLRGIHRTLGILQMVDQAVDQLEVSSRDRSCDLA